MAATINTNIASINAQRNLNLSGQSLNTTMQRLSSGLRVNSAKDDAAGLAIAERMNTQVKGLTVASRNANDGISLAQTAEGALGKVGDMLQRMRELAVQASNATNSDSDRKALQAEVSQLAAEIDRVAKQTNFNGQKILDGSFAGAVFQVGANSGDNVTLGALADTRSSQLSTINYATATLGAVSTDDTTNPGTPAIANFAVEIPAGTLNINVGNGAFNIDLEKIEPANSSLERLGQVVTAINNKTADTGVTAYMTRNDGTQTYEIVFVSSKVDANQVPLAVEFTGFSSSTTGIGGTVTPLTPTMATVQTAYDGVTAPTTGDATAVVAAYGTTVIDTLNSDAVLIEPLASSLSDWADLDATNSLSDAQTLLSTIMSQYPAALAAAEAATALPAPMDMNAPGNNFKTNQRGIEDIDVTTQAGAWVALKKIDSAIDQVNSARATLGAMQTRFENAVNNIDIQVENLSAARGRIVDADFAVETANLSRTQILQQAGTAMVSQANQIPQNVLQLLQN